MGKSAYCDLESKIPIKNLLNIHEWLSRIGQNGECQILRALEASSLIISDDDYQISVGNQEEFFMLKRKLEELAAYRSMP